MNDPIRFVAPSQLMNWILRCDQAADQHQLRMALRRCSRPITSERFISYYSLWVVSNSLCVRIYFEKQIENVWNCSMWSILTYGQSSRHSWTPQLTCNRSRSGNLNAGNVVVKSLSTKSSMCGLDQPSSVGRIRVANAGITYLIYIRKMGIFGI